MSDAQCTPMADVDAIDALFALPFADLLLRAQQVHRAHHAPNAVQLSTLLSIKTGGCPEDCGYCPQAARYHAGVANEPLLEIERVVEAARKAQAAGATRFCMGAAWRGPRERDLAPVLDMVAAVKALGLETCCTLGMLKDGQAEQLKRAGLDYYNHNLDTAPEFYGEIISTRDYRDRLDTLARVRHAGLDFYNHNLDTAPEFYGDIISTRDFSDRLDTLARVRDAGIAVCCGGIVGMGETRRQRAALIAQLASLAPPPESVPINHLVQVEGTPLHARFHGEAALDPLEFVRTIAVTRITLPRAMIRLSAGRRELGEPVQALCYFAGANSIFYGDRLLTTGNPDVAADRALFDKLGLAPA
jgi:biotin synthase